MCDHEFTPNERNRLALMIRLDHMEAMLRDMRIPTKPGLRAIYQLKREIAELNRRKEQANG